MNLQSKKDHIKSELDKVDDIDLINAIKNLLTYGITKQHEQSLRPMSEDVFYARNEESRKAIEESQLISQAEAKSYFLGKHAS